MQADPRLVVAAARGWIGTPYHDQASVRGAGCDCLGLARGIWREVVGPEPHPVPPYSRDWGEVGPREVLADGAGRWMGMVPVAEVGPGALLLFRMRDGAIAKHVGILTGPIDGTNAGPASFIHSCDRLGVIEEPLTPAWRRRIALAFLFPSPAETR